MSQPDKIPEWATESDNVVEPIEDKKKVGWSTGEPVASGHINWLFLFIYRWIVWAKDAIEAMQPQLADAIGRITGTAPDAGPGIEARGASPHFEDDSGPAALLHGNSRHGPLKLAPMSFTPSHSAPNLMRGELYCADGSPAKLYFHDGTEWREVLLSPST